MKKIISLFLVSMLCLSMLLMTSCSSSSDQHPIEEFAEKMAEADSYQVALTMSDVPFLGTISFTLKVDGNIEYMPETVFEPEQYIEKVGDIEYSYSKDDNGNWVKTQVEEEEEDSSDNSDDNALAQLFDPENYEPVEGKENTYQQKAGVSFEDLDGMQVEDVVISIDDTSCTIEMTATIEGMVVGMKLVFSKIGEIELTLPTVS
jgi:hypothetical protein